MVAPTTLVAATDLRRQRRRLLELIRVNETLRFELRRQRNKLLTANQDQYFLFERLRNYEKCPALQPAQRHQLSDTLTPLSPAAAAASAAQFLRCHRCVDSDSCLSSSL